MRQWTSREFIKVLKKNGYVYSRHNGDNIHKERLLR